VDYWTEGPLILFRVGVLLCESHAEVVAFLLGKILKEIKIGFNFTLLFLSFCEINPHILKFDNFGLYQIFYLKYCDTVCFK